MFYSNMIILLAWLMGCSVADEVRDKFPQVNKLTSTTKTKIFMNAPHRVQSCKLHYPDT
jgi:hypothetical protein